MQPPAFIAPAQTPPHTSRHAPEAAGVNASTMSAARRKGYRSSPSSARRAMAVAASRDANRLARREMELSSRTLRGNDAVHGAPAAGATASARSSGSHRLALPDTRQSDD